MTVGDRIAQASEQRKTQKERTKREKRALKLAAKTLTTYYKLKFVHLRASRHMASLPAGYDERSLVNPKGGCTLAWTHENRGVRVSCAYVHKKDHYNKLTGRLVAARRFHNGESILIRVPKNTVTVARVLHDMFWSTAQ